MSHPGLTIWTVYRYPADYPEQFVARAWVNGEATDEVLVAPSIEALRALLPPGLTRLPRSDCDPWVVVESWL